MSTSPQVMIIDEDGIFRQELQAMLTPARIAVVADCGYGVAAVSLAQQTKPNLVLAAVEQPMPAPCRQSRPSTRHCPACRS